MRYAESTFGGVDIVINNAGIQHVAPVEQFPVDKWNDILAINLQRLPHHPPRRCRVCASATGGASSTLPQCMAWWRRKKSAYAAKHAVVGLTKTVAPETARSGITCNARPGWVLTPLVQQQIDKRIAEGSTWSSAQLLAEKQPSGEFVTRSSWAKWRCFCAAMPPCARRRMEHGWRLGGAVAAGAAKIRTSPESVSPYASARARRAWRYRSSAAPR